MTPLAFFRQMIANGVPQDVALEIAEKFEADRDAETQERLEGLLDRIVSAPRANIRVLDRVAERKRARDRERMRLYREADWDRLRSAVFVRDAFQCVYCGAPAADDPHCDHVLALSRGGTNDISNLATACATCNLAKGAKTVAEWLGGGR